MTIAGVGLAVALMFTGSAEAAQPSVTPGAAAAGWMARQLVNGDHFESVFDGVSYPDQGLTADAVLAFDAAGVAQDSAVKATMWLAKPDILEGYLGDGTTESYAGPHAKLALVAEAQGLDPAAFGGVDLITALKALQAPSGRFSDKSGFGDFSNGITQALAVIALHRAGGAPQPAVDYLAGSRCPERGFPLDFEKATCESDVDTTGFVVQALLAAGRTAEATEALKWLEQVQQPSGAFLGSGPTAVENSNSTGLAAEALRAGGRTAAADRAVAFLTSIQVGCAAAEVNRGAIAYDATGFNAGSAVRATAQAVRGITGIGLAAITNTGAAADAPLLRCDTTPPPAAPSPPDAVTNPPLAVTGVASMKTIGLGILLVATGFVLVAGFRRPATKARDR